MQKVKKKATIKLKHVSMQKKEGNRIQ